MSMQFEYSKLLQHPLKCILHLVFRIIVEYIDFFLFCSIIELPLHLYNDYLLLSKYVSALKVL